MNSEVPLARKIVFGIVIALVALLAAALFIRPAPKAAAFAGIFLDPSIPAKDFALQGPGGEITLADLKGRYVVLFFGYTSCPDVCPTTLARISSAVRAIGREAIENVQVVLVSVDPERDTPERLAAYTAAFGENVIGLTGTPEQVASVASAYGIHFAKRESESEIGYLVDHTATVTVLDRDGRVRLLWPPTLEPDEIASDLRILLGA